MPNSVNYARSRVANVSSILFQILSESVSIRHRNRKIEFTMITANKKEKVKFHRLTVEFYWILRHNRNCGASRWVPWDEALGSWSWKDESGEQSERKSCVTFFPVYHANWLKNHHNSAINSKNTNRNSWHPALPWSSILPDHQKKNLFPHSLQIAIFCGFSWRIHDDSSRITPNCLPAEADLIDRPRYQTNPLLKSEVHKREKEKKGSISSTTEFSWIPNLTRRSRAHSTEQTDRTFF